MANYEATSTTNMFKVKDEDKYEKLFENLCGEYIEDFSYTAEDGTVYHGFGAYGSIDYIDCGIDEDGNEYEDYDFDIFLNKMVELIADDDAFIYTEVGNEKLRYVEGFVAVVTSKGTECMSLSSWAAEKLGPQYKAR